LDHPYPAKTSFDGGELDCGSGLLLLIRKHIDPLLPGELLEIRSREISVGEELPAWCRMTGNQLVSHLRRGGEQSFLVSKGPFRGAPPGGSEAPAPRDDERDTNITAPRVESSEEVIARASKAVRLFGGDRVLLAPDCGFATFADNPIASAAIAAGKLKSIAQAAEILRQKEQRAQPHVS
jgi:TusA-related sulfurtransferase